MLTDHGLEPIADIAIGDSVLAYNETTGCTDVYSVTATWTHTDPVLVTLLLDDEVITATPEHPFFVAGHGWVAAGDLIAGSAIQQADGTPGMLRAVQVEQRAAVMYNLTVDTAHTYFVGDGAWLVHNDCGGPRMRHYTSRSGSNGIESSNTIKASAKQWESGCVYCERANRNPMSPRDAEKYYQLDGGRGRDFVEFDTYPGEARSVSNPRTGRTEWVVDGDVNLTGRNARITRR